MGKTIKRKLSPSLKAKVAVEALKELKTIPEIAPFSASIYLLRRIGVLCGICLPPFSALPKFASILQSSVRRQIPAQWSNLEKQELLDGILKPSQEFWPFPHQV